MSNRHENSDAEAALDSLLAAHQASLHCAVASALDTRTGLAQATRWSRTLSSRIVSDISLVHKVQPCSESEPAVIVVEAKSEGSALVRVLDALNNEVQELGHLMEQLSQQPMVRRTTPPGASKTSVASLLATAGELTRIKELLVNSRITKASASAEFKVAEALLQEQVHGWAEKGDRVPHAKRHLPTRNGFYGIRDLFEARYTSVVELRTLIIKLFEDVDETVLQLN
ncbi:hypothetical protein ABZ667_42010 [Streptomyces lavendulae]|uniref:hypothetical protein n=1 Tax=Streptomyces lavendulae TaxID=1914 RepID=UPI0033CF5056